MGQYTTKSAIFSQLKNSNSQKTRLGRSCKADGSQPRNLPTINLNSQNKNPSVSSSTLPSPDPAHQKSPGMVTTMIETKPKHNGIVHNQKTNHTTNKNRNNKPKQPNNQPPNATVTKKN